MDPQNLIFDISSDEEFGFDNSSTADDLDWIAKLLEDVTDVPADHNSGHEAVDVKVADIKNVSNDADDDVVVVGEVIVKSKRAKRSFSVMNSGGVDDDDDCVVLECDPDKPPPPPSSSKVVDDEVKNSDDLDDSDDLVVVGEKGQVACRDFPHSRHLCANFPFSSTSHESRCDLCHCYVCDSLAPCAYWGSGASTTDHCHATDKAVYWQTERKKFRQSKNPPVPISKPVASLGQFPQSLETSGRPCVHLRGSAACARPPSFGIPNIVSQVRGQRPYVAVARDGYQRHLVARQLLRVRNGDTQGSRAALLAPRMNMSRPMFKRSVLPTRSGVPNPALPIWPGNASLAAKSADSPSANLRGSSSQMVTNPVLRQSIMRSMTSQLPGYGLPNTHAPPSTFPEFSQPGQLAAVVSDNNQYTNSSLHQAQSISSPLIHCNSLNALKSGFQGGQQQHQPVEAQNTSVPDFLVPTSDLTTSIPQMNHPVPGVMQCLSSTPTSTLNPPNSGSRPQ